MKGIKSECRENFINEFMWLDNNIWIGFERTLELIKV